MVKRSIDFPNEFYERLQAQASKMGVTVSAVIKIACSEYLEKVQKEENKK